MERDSLRRVGAGVSLRRIDKGLVTVVEVEDGRRGGGMIVWLLVDPGVRLS